jgi:hypothetical protein
MATVAAVANGFGTDGWMLTDLVSAHHNTYILTFEPASVTEEVAQGTETGGPRRAVSTSLG